MDRMAAFILAGGAGTRLSLLTAFRAKPAVTFAGRYRIIDFTLTNCVRSEISLVHVLTQYISRSLNRHLGIGRPWDLDRRQGGLHILHPRLGFEAADWYKGTADAIYQNIPVLKKLKEEYILILSGDHVYNMDYRRFLEFHVEKGRPASVAVVEVPSRMTSEFGIVSVDDSGKVTSFREKPKSSSSRLASMGIYIFKKDFLLAALKEIKSRHDDLDFGKHILPELVRLNKVSAFRYNGFWLDIGTLRSYYEANLSLLNDSPRVKLGRAGGSILTVPDDDPPMMIEEGSSVKRSLVCDGCVVTGSVLNSVISPHVTVAKGASVENSIILHRCTIKKGARIRNSIIDEGCVIGEGAQIGTGDRSVPNVLQPDFLDFGVTLIGKGTRIPPGMKIGTNCLIAGNMRSGRVSPGKVADGGVRVPSDLEF